MMKPFALLPVLAWAATSATAAPTEAELIRRAEGGGTLVAMMQFCRMPATDIRPLAIKLEHEVLLAAQEGSVTFDSAAFREHARAGLQSMRSLLAHMPDKGPGYETNCQDVREQVKDAMAR